MAQGDSGQSGQDGKAFILVLLALALGAAVSGAGFNLVFLSAGVSEAVNSDGGGLSRSAVPAASKTKSKDGDDKVQKSDADHHSPGDQMVPLDPILVTLAGPRHASLRLEAAVIFTAAPKEDRGLLMKIMAQDILSFLRTLSLAQIEGAAGLEFLREDLSDIVRQRSKGRARGVVLRTMMVE